MTSTHKKDDPKIGLGQKTDSGYKYSSRIDFKEDLSLQIAKLMKEKKAKEELESHMEQIRKVALRFKNKTKNLNYYQAVGLKLSFINSVNFKNIKPYSILRRIVDEIPDVLPGLDQKRMQDHLMMMYRIGKLDEEVLSKATWEQWYEISKFNNVITKQKFLKKVLALKGGASGQDLRKKIESITSDG